MAYNFFPTAQNVVFTPDQLIGGSLDIVTDTVTLLSGRSLLRGALLGKQSVGAATSAAKSGGNTGNGTLVVDATTPVLTNAGTGIYTVRIITAGTNSFTARVTDPRGVVLGDVAVSGAGASGTFSDRIKFAITDGATDFVVGDGFDVTVAAGAGKFVLATAAAVDGSADPANWVILGEDTDATSADQTCPVYRMGEFNVNYMTFGAGITAASAKASIEGAGAHLFLKIGALANTIV